MVSVGFCRLSNSPQLRRSEASSGTAHAATDAIPPEVIVTLRTDDRRAPDRNMVYCVGCAHKARSRATRTVTAARAVETEAAGHDRSWMQERFLSVLSTLGLAAAEEETEIEPDIPRTVSGRSRLSSTGSRDEYNDEAEVLEALAGPARTQTRGGTAPASAMTMVWPALTLLLGVPTDEADSPLSAPGSPAQQHVWFALCDACWTYLRL